MSQDIFPHNCKFDKQFVIDVVTASSTFRNWFCSTSSGRLHITGDPGWPTVTPPCYDVATKIKSYASDIGATTAFYDCGAERGKGPVGLLKGLISQVDRNQGDLSADINPTDDPSVDLLNDLGTVLAKKTANEPVFLIILNIDIFELSWKIYKEPGANTVLEDISELIDSSKGIVKLLLTSPRSLESVTQEVGVTNKETIYIPGQYRFLESQYMERMSAMNVHWAQSKAVSETSKND